MRAFAFCLMATTALAVCPQLECASDLDSGVCAEYVSEASVKINKSACEDGKYCTVEDFEDWIDTAYNNPTLQCTSSSDFVVDYTDRVKNCSARDDDKDLEDGDYPKECSLYGGYTSVCGTKDGEDGYCECGYDGKAYCKPLLSSDAFDDYWSECWDNEGKLKNTEHAAFWYLKYTYYVKYISSYSCAHNMFYEFIKLDDYDYVGDYAGWIIASIALILV